MYTETIKTGEDAILSELYSIEQKRKELETRLKKGRQLVEKFKEGNYSPVRLHVMFRQHGTTFSALVRAIQGAMCPGTRVLFVSMNNKSQQGRRIADIVKAYYGDGYSKIKLFPNNEPVIKFPNGSTIRLATEDTFKKGVGLYFDRVIVDFMMLEEDEAHQKVGMETVGAIMNKVTYANDPQVDVYFSYDPGDAYSGVVDYRRTDPDYIVEILKLRLDFGPGVKSGAISWDINRI